MFTEGVNRGAMASVHLIALPRQRIFDAVTLTPEHIDLLQETMLKVKDLFQQARFKQYLAEQGYHLDVDPEDVDFFVQPYPMASVGHLCIHCLAENLKNSGVREQKHKNLPLNRVIQVLKNEETHSALGREHFIRTREIFKEIDGGNLAATVSAWERGEITGAEATERTREGSDTLNGHRGVKGMEIKPANFVEPIFTLFVEGGGPKPGQIFYEDDEMMIFPNVKEATRQLQKAKDKGQGDGSAASMSYVHMLAIPKKRIYNAVSLKQKDAALVRRMMEKAKAALADAKTQEYYINQKDLDLSTTVFDVSQLEFFMHCHPSHSVGHLHLHCCMRNLWTLNGAALAAKNMIARHVLEVIEAATATAPITQLALLKMRQNDLIANVLCSFNAPAQSLMQRVMTKTKLEVARNKNRTVEAQCNDQDRGGPGDEPLVPKAW
jgi:diadenosine tetraphosphate (Ap4A) HIT family hydrolase